MLFFCNKEWEPQGIIGQVSFEVAKEKAEIRYKGISNKWVNAEAPQDELYRFVRVVYEVDPDSEWWKVECAFYGKGDLEVERMFGIENENTYICDNCVSALSEVIN